MKLFALSTAFVVAGSIFLISENKAANASDVWDVVGVPQPPEQADGESLFPINPDIYDDIPLDPGQYGSQDPIWQNGNGYTCFEKNVICRAHCWLHACGQVGGSSPSYMNCYNPCVRGCRKKYVQCLQSQGQPSSQVLEYLEYFDALDFDLQAHGNPGQPPHADTGEHPHGDPGMPPPHGNPGQPPHGDPGMPPSHTDQPPVTHTVQEQPHTVQERP